MYSKGPPLPPHHQEDGPITRLLYGGPCRGQATRVHHVHLGVEALRGRDGIQLLVPPRKATRGVAAASPALWLRSEELVVVFPPATLTPKTPMLVFPTIWIISSTILADMRGAKHGRHLTANQIFSSALRGLRHAVIGLGLVQARRLRQRTGHRDDHWGAAAGLRVRHIDHCVLHDGDGAAVAAAETPVLKLQPTRQLGIQLLRSGQDGCCCVFWSNVGTTRSTILGLRVTPRVPRGPGLATRLGLRGVTRRRAGAPAVSLEQVLRLRRVQGLAVPPGSRLFEFIPVPPQPNDRVEGQDELGGRFLLQRPAERVDHGGLQQGVVPGAACEADLEDQDVPEDAHHALARLGAAGHSAWASKGLAHFVVSSSDPRAL
mmetsp:Transcript_73115/g.218163  ORF Transcript_73115/g.218163 Transcript_73115/m.218163 type:complete len:375 (+) Transcript_73115:578-1702(+)